VIKAPGNFLSLFDIVLSILGKYLALPLLPDDKFPSLWENLKMVLLQIQLLEFPRVNLFLEDDFLNF